VPTHDRDRNFRALPANWLALSFTPWKSTLHNSSRIRWDRKPIITPVDKNNRKVKERW
jgi:hypothetical protein